MADHSTIEWTDATWNPVTGCTIVSPGCTNCYAMKLAGTRLKHHFSREGLTINTKAGPVWNGQTRVNWEWIDQPLQWSRARRIFVCAHGDLFHPSVEWADIAQIYGVMIAAHHLRSHILQILTKRPDRARELLSREDFWDIANAHASMEIMERVDPLDRRRDDARATCDHYGPDNPPPGLWLGTSVEDQVRADERIPHLLAAPAAVRFLSCEPLLGPIDLNSSLGGTLWIGGQRGCGAMHHGTGAPDCPRHLHHHHDDRCRAGIDWVIAGGESGPGARPMHPDWARSLRDQCAAARVPFFFKQWGEFNVGWIERSYPAPGYESKNPPPWWPDGTRGQGDHRVNGGLAVSFTRVGKKRAGRLLDGIEHNGMPASIFNEEE